LTEAPDSALPAQPFPGNGKSKSGRNRWLWNLLVFLNTGSAAEVQDQVEVRFLFLNFDPIRNPSVEDKLTKKGCQEERLNWFKQPFCRRPLKTDCGKNNKQSNLSLFDNPFRKRKLAA